MGLLKKRRGSLQDLVYIGAIIFTLAITLLVAYRLNSDITEHFENNTQIDNTRPMQQATTSLQIFDYGFIGIMIAMLVGVVFLAYQIPTHPIFLPVSIIFLAILVLVSSFYVNVYDKIANTTFMQSAANSLPWITTVMQNFHIVMAVLGTIVIIAMYSSRGVRRREAV